MGFTLVEELPFAHVVDRRYVDKVCANCMKPVWERDVEGTLSRCVRCKFAHYCNSSCQKKDWSNHKAECSYLSRIAEPTSDSVPRLMARIITKLHRDGDTNAAFNGRLFASLETNRADIEKDEEMRNGFIAIAHIIKNYLALADLPPCTQIFEIFCKVLVNALVVTDNCLNATGLAVYLGLSALDHSCNPDAFIISSGIKATLRSLKKEVTQYSDKLRITYCDLMDISPVRQEILKKQYNFVCGCEVCKDSDLDRQKSSLRCTKCSDGYCPFNPEEKEQEAKCKICHKTSDVSFDFVQRLDQQIRLWDSTEKDLDKLLKLYHECREVFSPYNVQLCRLAESVMVAAEEKGKYAEAVECAEKILACYRAYYPSGHPSLSVRMYEYAKMLMLEQNELCIPTFQKALEMICESHGPESNFALETAKMLNNLQQQIPSSS